MAWVTTKQASGVPDGDAAEMTVAQAFASYVNAKVLAPNTVEVFEHAKGKAVAQGVGAVKLAALKPSQVDAFTAWLVRQGLAASTVNIYAAKLCAVLRFAAADGAMTFLPKASKVKVTVVKEPAMTPADVKALYEASSEDFAPIIILGAYAGMRASEAAAVTVADIDFTASTITVSKAIDEKGDVRRDEDASVDEDHPDAARKCSPSSARRARAGRERRRWRRTPTAGF